MPYPTEDTADDEELFDKNKRSGHITVIDNPPSPAAPQALLPGPSSASGHLGRSYSGEGGINTSNRGTSLSDHEADGDPQADGVWGNAVGIPMGGSSRHPSRGFQTTIPSSTQNPETLTQTTAETRRHKGPAVGDSVPFTLRSPHMLGYIATMSAEQQEAFGIDIAQRRIRMRNIRKAAGAEARNIEESARSQTHHFDEEVTLDHNSHSIGPDTDDRQPISPLSRGLRPHTLSNPFVAGPLPPPDESPKERTPHVQVESGEESPSERIDELPRPKKTEAGAGVNILLLGQSESGKSTTLKQFQLLYSPAEFHSKRIAWRTVIYLNLISSVRRILEALAPESDGLEGHNNLDSTRTGADLIIPSDEKAASTILDSWGTKHEEYRRRLAPLAELEDRLTRLLVPSVEDELTHLAPPLTTISADDHDSRSREVPVQLSYWKRGFSKYKSKGLKTPKSGEIEGWWEDPDDPAHTLHLCAKAMQELWADPEVRKKLHEKRFRLEESNGFYLNDVSRITAFKYIPTDADVLKAQLKTTRIVEYTFTTYNGPPTRSVQWRIHDVKGTLDQRQAWAPYFDDVNAIIFLAPISAFDQVLAEDHRVNRLEDSLVLWKSLVSNIFLAKANIILFLNKCDLLQSKLQAGVRLSHYITSYGDRPNDYESVSRYFYNKFGALHMAYSRNKERDLYIHYTTVTDTRRTATIITSVKDMIIKKRMRTMRLV